MKEIIQIHAKDFPKGKKAVLQYTSDCYYQVKVMDTTQGWRVDLVLEKLTTPFVKTLETDVFSEYKENLQVRIVKKQGKEIGLISFNHQSWNNCTRVWDLYIEPAFQRGGVGSQLMRIANDQAKKWGARALVVETQTSNVKAINFYRKHKFFLVGLDLISYSNEDIDKKEVRREMAKKLA